MSYTKNVLNNSWRMEWNGTEVSQLCPKPEVPIIWWTPASSLLSAQAGYQPEENEDDKSEEESQGKTKALWDGR